MQHDAFQQVAQGQIVKFGQGLEHFEEPLLDAHAGLHSLHDKLLMIFRRSHYGTNVPRYTKQMQTLAIDNLTRTRARRIAAAKSPHSVSDEVASDSCNLS
jgi:hypothetical protein